MPRKSMHGGPRSFCFPPKAPARTRSCGGPASPRLASGAGRNALCRKASTAFFATRHAPLAFRRSGKDVAERVVALTLQDPPGEATHWTGAMMAKAARISVSSVQRIWRAHGLQPHRVRQFKLSKDPAKSQIQALDRTQPGLPLKKGRAGTMTHDYKRHGTTTLFAALNVLDGTVIGRNMQRRRHQEFIRFLNAIEAEVPAGKIVRM
jgi:hypothetical protein